MSHYQTCIVPYDFSEHSRAALYTSLDLAHRLDADLHLLHAIQPPAAGYGYAAFGGATVGAAALPPPAYMAEVREGAEKALRSAAEAATSRMGVRIESHLVESPSVSEAIVQFAEEHEADLIVMGTHGRSGIAHVFLGSVTERTLRHAPCPVLAVPLLPLPEGG